MKPEDLAEDNFKFLLWYSIGSVEFNWNLPVGLGVDTIWDRQYATQVVHSDSQVLELPVR